MTISFLGLAAEIRNGEFPYIISVDREEIFFFSEMLMPVLVATQPRIQCAPSFLFFSLSEESGRGVKLTTHFHLVPKLGMSGFCLLHPLYAFISYIGSNSLYQPKTYTDEQVTVAVRL